MDSMNLHAHYPDVTKHWAANSERYACGAALLTRLRGGWEITGAIYSEIFWHAGARPVTIYHFVLSRADEQIVMPVVTTPYVRRMIYTWKLEVRPYDEYRALQKQRRTGVNI
jgi:hypothetical protein